MGKHYWHIFFDLHGVLADVNAVNKNYQNYLIKILTPTGISLNEVKEIHEKGFKKWITDITHLFNEFEEWENDETSLEAFMRNYKLIDWKWEEFILDFVPLKHKKSIRPLLNTSLVEYEALVNGPYPILYPEVNPLLKELKKIKDLFLHIASSASSEHVKGAVDLHNLRNFFINLIGYDTVRAPKKASSGIYFKSMLEITDANPSRSIFVGDSKEEANLASKFGMEYIMVWRDFHSEESRNMGFRIIDNLTALLPIIKELIV
ncbi:MAG: HAD family hydrolase [Promethearchaeota archaeon]